MGEVQAELFSEYDTAIRPSFNGSIRVEAREERLTSDAGALLAREVMDRIRLIEWIGKRVWDPRDPQLVKHSLIELLRTQLLLLVQGWTASDDADFLRDDPAFRLAVSERRQDAPLRIPDDPGGPDGLASQPTLSRLLATLSHEKNDPVLQEANLFLVRQRCGWAEGRKRYEHLTLDMDSIPIKVHGYQKGSAYNGHYHQRCYHPLVFGSADIDALFGATLREGQVYTSKDALDDLTRCLDWAEEHVADNVSLRADAGFPSDEVLTVLEERRCPYVCRFKKHDPLKGPAQDRIQHYLKNLRERPEETREEEFRCYEMEYQGKEWSRARRIVLVIVRPPEGELPFEPRHFFLVTSTSEAIVGGERLVDHYRERGCYEEMLGQLKSTLAPQLSSTNRGKSHYRGKEPQKRYDPRDPFATNQAILSLNVLAYNILGTVALLHKQAHRHPGRPKKYGRSSSRITLSTVRKLYMKVPARITLHARRVWFSINESAAELWESIWTYLDRLGYAPAAP